MSEFALSTSWNAPRHNDAKAIIDEIIKAGFDSIELSFALTGEIVADISSMVRIGTIKVKSLHNYCPIPEGLRPNQASPDYYSLSSLDEAERKKAVYFTRQTIEQASGLGAEAVVLHCGKVKLSDYTRKLIALHAEGKKDSREFIGTREWMFLHRRLKSKAHFEKALKSLDELNSFAKKKDIILGIENRFYFMEVPSFEEIALILKSFKGSKLYYWHDVGHAQVSEELGFARQKDFLQRYCRNMAGMHFHDVKGTKDHLAPGSGDFDFAILKPYLKDSLIKIIEAHWPATIDELRYARGYLDRALGLSSKKNRKKTKRS